jgi:hypothetical protein
LGNSEVSSELPRGQQLSKADMAASRRAFGLPLVKLVAYRTPFSKTVSYLLASDVLKQPSRKAPSDCQRYVFFNEFRQCR